MPPGKYYPLSPPAGARLQQVAASLKFSFDAISMATWSIPASYVRSLHGASLAAFKSWNRRRIHSFQKGSVLFVNIPLGYLEGYTDGLPLHAFIKYFASRVLSLPYLMPVPDGVGGIVLDWRVDSNAAIKAFRRWAPGKFWSKDPIRLTSPQDQNLCRIVAIIKASTCFITPSVKD